MEKTYTISLGKRCRKDGLIILTAIILIVLSINAFITFAYIVVGAMAFYSVFYNFRNRTTLIINNDKIRVRYPFYSRNYQLNKYNNYQIRDFIYKRIIANEIRTGKVVNIATNTYQDSLENILECISDFKDSNKK